jgi:electron transport complex protein RnfG
MVKLIVTDKRPRIASPWSMYRALVGVGIVCALLIVSVFLLTLSSIQQNRAEALERAIFKALPGVSTKQTYVLTEDERFRLPVTVQQRKDVIHAGFDREGRLVGVAIEAQGMGYQDVIRILYGYAPDRQAIVGMQVLDSKETPGLGDKIEKDSRFLQNFERLDVRLTEGGIAIKNPIVAVKSGQKSEPWQIEGITGATVSSKAVAEILAVSTGRWIPLLQSQVLAFTQAENNTGEAQSDL